MLRSFIGKPAVALPCFRFLVVGLSPQVLGVRSQSSPWLDFGGQIVTGVGFSSSTSVFPRDYDSTNAPYSLTYCRLCIILSIERVFKSNISVPFTSLSLSLCQFSLFVTGSRSPAFPTSWGLRVNSTKKKGLACSTYCRKYCPLGWTLVKLLKLRIMLCDSVFLTCGSRSSFINLLVTNSHSFDNSI
jgi:hypothetical protein